MFLCLYVSANGTDQYLNLSLVELVTFDGQDAILHFASRKVRVMGKDAQRVADWCCERDLPNGGNSRLVKGADEESHC